MQTSRRYFDDLNALLAAMPPGRIDLDRVKENELRHQHQFFDPPESVHQWLLDQQRRAQARTGAPDAHAEPALSRSSSR